jgi:hypothetical protein
MIYWRRIPTGNGPRTDSNIVPSSNLGTQFMELGMAHLYLVVDLLHLLITLGLYAVMLFLGDLALLQLGIRFFHLGPILTSDRVQVLDTMLDLFHLSVNHYLSPDQ